MARIVGVELSDNWKLDYALTKIKGIGWALSGQVLVKAGVSGSLRVSELTSSEVSKLTGALEGYEVEGDLARKIRTNIQRLKVTKSYRGTRHNKSLPARGQRTKSNARTKRGKRKTVGSFRKEELGKQKQGAGN